MKVSARYAVIASLIGCLAVATLLTAAPMTVRNIQFKSGNEMIDGFLAVPDTPGRHPALVVIHEYWGLTDWVKVQTEKLAQAGYVALAVDLYRGKIGITPDQARHLMVTTPKDRAVRDLKAGFAFLAARPDVNPSKIGSIGWCMGGGYSFLLAENEPKLAACVVNYGEPPTTPAAIESIQAPILGNFGADDQVIKPAAVRAFESAAKKDGKSVDIKIFDGAPHAFENEYNITGYRQDQTAQAWSRTFAFLAKTLK